MFISGAVPALLFGVAFGNLFLGVPFHIDDLGRPVYTGAFIGLLHPFALLAGAASLAMLAMHGATYAALKVGEPMAGRARRAASIAAVALLVVALTLAGVWLTHLEGLEQSGIVPAGPSNPLRKSVETAAEVGGDAGKALSAFLARRRSSRTRWRNHLAAARCGGPGLRSSRARSRRRACSDPAGSRCFRFCCRPRASRARASRSASSSQRTLFTMLLVTLVLLPIVLIYTSWVFHVMRGTITLEHVREGAKSY